MKFNMRRSEGGEGGADVYGGLLDDLGVVSPFQNRDVDSTFRISDEDFSDLNLLSQ